jgi:hypothetical protein
MEISMQVYLFKLNVTDDEPWWGQVRLKRQKNTMMLGV